jgi:hypothetical protein
MTTPCMAFSICLRNAVLSFWTLWVFTFVVTRLYALHEAYVFEVQQMLAALAVYLP